MGRVIRRRRAHTRTDQRIWQGRRVDKDLKDEWLEGLNNLSCMDLVSICWGHSQQQGRSRSQPRINLRLKPEFASFFHTAREVGWIRDTFTSRIPHPTASLETESRVMVRNNGDPRHAVVVRLAMPDQDEITQKNEWFEKILAGVRAADADLATILNMPILQIRPAYLC